MKRIRWTRAAALFVSLVATFALPNPAAHAQTYEGGEDGPLDQHLVPTLSLGLGGFFPLSPDPDSHIIGSAMLGLQTRLVSNGGHSIALLTEVGYSGDRRGYLEGRHLVLGAGLRHGRIFGSTAMLQFALGRTDGERSMAVRAGVRFDLFHYVGAIVLYEGRHVQTGVDDGLVGRGVRFEVFFDPVRFARVIAEID